MSSGGRPSWGHSARADSNADSPLSSSMAGSALQAKSARTLFGMGGKPAMRRRSVAPL
eukprot:CAMPEP_0117550770 /NCGR_PEP_ID=MMETSP0784-20121206/48850_1 /TAXON_ID=39447 /ORGANISM="" /LENGTH=57 /DNA_ID=CAMNT_0005347795 /DNA_START=87 /DNA_END=260 /DNA_ORIENTATION=+